MNRYYISKLEMILVGQLRETESENYKSAYDIDILESLLRQSPGNLKQTIDRVYALYLPIAPRSCARTIKRYCFP
jgi:hypothetical protein